MQGPSNLEDPNIESMLRYPNPVQGEVAKLEFYLKKTEWLSFSLLDLNGKQVKLLGEDRVKAGKNVLSFSTSTLAEGTYVITVKDAENKIRYNEKLLVLP